MGQALQCNDFCAGEDVSAKVLDQGEITALPQTSKDPEAVQGVDDEDIGDQMDVGRTKSKPFAGNPAFRGSFSAQDATRAGFFSVLRPPDPGEQVVCFHRKHWLERGVVQEVHEEVSDGQDGLAEGAQGARVLVACEDGHSFKTWASFLASADDREYSAICTTEEFQESNYVRLVNGDGGDASSSAAARVRTSRVAATEAVTVTKAEARSSLQAWLGAMVDADGEEVEVPTELKDELLGIFDERQDASLHLYSLHKRLVPRTSLKKGNDYSLYYQALNNTLNHDTEEGLRSALPLVRRMIYLLLYDEKTGERRLHEGGRVWKGDSSRPAPLNVQKMKDALRNGTFIHFRQFQSTTSDENVAARFRKREEKLGFMWIIDIPPKFFGARNIQDVSWRSNESETLFPPYSAFQVLSLEDDCCHLKAAGLL